MPQVEPIHQSFRRAQQEDCTAPGGCTSPRKCTLASACQWGTTRAQQPKKLEFTAGALTILLWYYWTTEPYPHSDSLSYNDAVTQLVALQLVTHVPGASDGLQIQLTDRGRVHVQALCRAPLPEQQWVSPLESEQ